MKYSCSSDLLFNAGGSDFKSMIEIAAELNVDGINLSLGKVNKLSPMDFPLAKSAVLVNLAQEKGIEIQAISDIYIDDDNHDKQLLFLKNIICLAHSLACPLIAFQLAPFTDEQQSKYIKIIAEACDFANDLDLCLALETQENTGITTIEDALQLVDTANQSNLGIVYNSAFDILSENKAPITHAELIKSYLLMISLRTNTANDILRGELDQMIATFKAVEFEHYLADYSPSYALSSDEEIKELILENSDHCRAVGLDFDEEN